MYGDMHAHICSECDQLSLSLSLSLYLIPFIHSLEVYVDTYSDKPPYEEDFLAHEFLWSARGMVPKQGTGID